MTFQPERRNKFFIIILSYVRRMQQNTDLRIVNVM